MADQPLKISRKQEALTKPSSTVNFRLSKCNGTSAASEFVAKLSNDLLLEILVRLPDRRNVIRCSSVCKTWLSLITEPQFSHIFVGRHGSELAALMFQKHEYERHLSHFDPKFNQILSPDENKTVESNSILSFLPWDDVVIRASFDDLLLVSRPNTDEFSYCDKTNLLKLYVCNPVTKKWCPLPLPPRGILKLQRCGLLCYNNSEYKVVVLCETTKYGWRSFNNRDLIHLTVFSSETGRWSPLNVLSYPEEFDWWMGISVSMAPFNNTVPHNGCLYWLGDLTTIGDTQSVFCIDPVAAATGIKRCWQFISMPRNDDAFSIFSLLRHRLGVCNGKLRLGNVSCFESPAVHILRVWELLDQYQTPTVSSSDDQKMAEDPMDLGSYYSNSHCWSLVYEAELEYTDVIEAKKDCCMLAFHPSHPDVVFVQYDNAYISRYDMVRRRGATVGKYPVGECAPGREISTYALCVRSLWPSQVPS